MLSAWAAKAAAKRDVALVCVLRTHLAYLFRDTTWAEITGTNNLLTPLNIL